MGGLGSTEGGFQGSQLLLALEPLERQRDQGALEVHRYYARHQGQQLLEGGQAALRVCFRKTPPPLLSPGLVGIKGEIVRQRAAGNKNIIGAMLESHLVAGNQAFPQPLDTLVKGQSITDKCIDMETTERLVLAAANAL